MRLLTKLQYHIFLNAVPQRLSTIGTIIILVHCLLALIGAPFILILYDSIGNEDFIILKVLGTVGITLGMLIIIAIIATFKVYKILGQMLLLCVYGMGCWISSTMINLYGQINPNNLLKISYTFLWILLFFLLSGYFNLLLLVITLYSTITKRQVNYCYKCNTIYKFSDQFCETCGNPLLPSFLQKNQPKKVVTSN